MKNYPLYQVAILIYINPKKNWKNISSSTKDVSGVYALLNKTNGKTYIGCSVNLYNRLRDYFSPWYIKTYPNLLISKAITKYGSNNFSVLILEKCRKKDVYIKEQE